MTMISENAVVVGAGHARDQKMVRGHGPLLHGIPDFTREQKTIAGSTRKGYAVVVRG